MLERNFLSKNYEALQRLVESARPEGSKVTLLAATKTQSADTIATIHEFGIQHVGENYLAEAEAKMAKLAHLDLTWHFIGRIQSNKTQQIANQFAWVHCIDREKIARRIANQRLSATPINVLIQVNIDQDTNKGGVQPNEVMVLAKFITTLPQLRLRGLMTILDPSTKPAVGYRSMAQLAQQVGSQFDEAQRAHWDTLSMGMSNDILEAVEAGATIVRVGTALFGPRA